MSSTEIIFITALFLLAGFQIYRKYVKKDTDKPGTGSNKESDSSFSSISKDDDYEPYSGK